MHYLLLIGAFIFFAFIAPLKVTIVTCLFLLVIAAVVRFSTQAVVGFETSYGQAAKAVGLSFFFLLVAFFTLFSFAKGTGINKFTGLAGNLVFAGFFSAYVLGFKLSLSLSFGQSAAVAIVSTVLSTALFVLLRGLFL